MVSLVPAMPQYLTHPPTLPKQRVYAPMAPLGALSLGLRKHRKSEEDQFSRLIYGEINFKLINAKFTFRLVNGKIVLGS
jgi:hypothetical protein